MKKKIILVLLSLLLAAGSIVAVSCAKKEKTKKKETTKEKSKEKEPVTAGVICPFCGEKLDAGTDPQRPIAVMVENMKQVRPQFGLDEACVVVEALTEGGITRFMLVFANKDVGRIGPVRSARSHFVAIAGGMNTIYAHAGGSKFALSDIKDWSIADIDQLKRSDAFWRTKGNAPHNLWTSTYKLRSEAKVLGYGTKAKGNGFKFKSEADAKKRPDKQNIVIDLSSATYKVEYRYEKDANSYLRLNGGIVHTDGLSGKEIKPKNIVIVFAPTSSIPGGGQVLDIDVVGKNKCLVFRDGKVVEGTWEKDSEKAPFYLYDSNEKQIDLNPGQTWVEVVKPNTKVTYDKGDAGVQ
jgi:hypothetical protein